MTVWFPFCDFVTHEVPEEVVVAGKALPGAAVARDGVIVAGVAELIMLAATAEKEGEGIMNSFKQ